MDLDIVGGNHSIYLKRVGYDIKHAHIDQAIAWIWSWIERMALNDLTLQSRTSGFTMILFVTNYVYESQTRLHAQFTSFGRFVLEMFLLQCNINHP